MPLRLFERIFLGIFLFLFSTPFVLAQTLDLSQLRTTGILIAEALDLGERGDWQGAEAVAARSNDVVARDIVLWRKLRAGDGSVLEYQSYISRRGSWPGQEILASTVFGGRVEPDGPAQRIAGPARRNWGQFTRLWRARKYDEAGAILASLTERSEALGDPTIWADRRRRLARRAVREGRIGEGYLLASSHFLTPEDGYAYADCEWISGWIALTKMNDPERALVHFRRFAEVVETPISLGRAGYWLGRAYKALGDENAASIAFGSAANHQTSFYGQLSATEIGHPPNLIITNQALPDWTTSPAIRSDEVRAAVILHFAGQERLAFQFFTHLGQRLQGPIAKGALAALALELDLHNYAVRIAKNAARDGIVLMPAYYPETELASYATAVEPAMAMAIARQETELNPRAISPVGARGLMQLMPATAKKVARDIGEDYSKSRLTEDWRYNARLGQAYLAEQIAVFGGSYAMAAAAYNAGPHRVDDWIGRYGDPRLPGVDIIDWIETIPFRETRNYVQRVMESLYVYRARLSGVAGPMTIRNDLDRGRR